MCNPYEQRLQEINMLLRMGIEANSPTEAKKLRQEREEILAIVNREDIQ